MPPSRAWLQCACSGETLASGQRTVYKTIAMHEIRQLSLDALELSVRSSNALHKYGCRTVGDVFDISYEDLLSIKNIGEKSAKEIEETKAASWRYEEEDGGYWYIIYGANWT